jgi:hypothetical protein
MKDLIVKILKENRNFYDYQFGFCHYFATNIKDKLQELLPNKEVNYYLIIAEELVIDTNEIIEYHLIHVYLKIDDYYIDSKGVHGYDDIISKIENYESEAIKYLPDFMELTIKEGESDEIPDLFFDNNECDQQQVKKDIEEFMSNLDIKKFIQEMKL